MGFDALVSFRPASGRSRPRAASPAVPVKLGRPRAYPAAGPSSIRRPHFATGGPTRLISSLTLAETTAALARHLPSFAATTVLVLGDVMLDRYVLGEVR